MATATHTDSPVIDFSAHFYADMPKWVEEKSSLIKLLKKKEGPISWDIEKAKERFTNAGLDGVVLSQASYMGHEDAEETREANDALLELIDPDPYFYGLAALPTVASGQAAAEEFERCLENGYNGGAIESWFHTDEVTLETLKPVFEVADRTGAPLFIHPKVNDSLGEGVLRDDYFLNAMFGRGAALSACVYTMIQYGYIDEYPNLNVVVHHMAGNIAGMSPRLEATLARKIDDLPYLGKSVDVKDYDEFVSQLRSNVFVDTAGFNCDYDILQKNMEIFPTRNIIFGSDYPCEIRRPEGYKRLFNSIREAASDEDADRILGQNALELLVNVKKLAR